MGDNRASEATGQGNLGEPVHVALVIVPRFPLLSLVICMDALRVANRESLRTVFVWTLASEDGKPVASSSQIPVSPDVSLNEIAFSPVSVVLAAYDPEHAGSEVLLKWLRKQNRRGAIIGCVDTGALILAKAGLLSKHGASVHQEVLASFREDFKDQKVSEHRFAFEGRRLSSAGGIATLDMMLRLIEHYQGRRLADRVAGLMNYSPTREFDSSGRDSSAMGVNPILARCVELMQTHLEDPLPLNALCQCAGVADWTLRRLFRRHLDTTPSAHYLSLRLKRGQQLLAYSHLSVNEIAVACGFADTASFSHAFKRQFGAPPSKSRLDDSGAPEFH